MKRRFCITIFTAMLTTALSVSVGGCNSSKSTSAYYDQKNAGYGEMVAETTAAAGYEEKSISGDSDTTQTLSSENGIPPVSTNRKLTRSVSMHVESTDFDSLIGQISQSVSALGGYLEYSNISGNSVSSYDQNRYADMIARVPSNSLDSFITQVGSSGNITSQTEITDDVTLRYSDVESRKKALTIEQERLWELLEKAESVDAVITLEARLSEIRYELESYESQLRLMDNQIDYSTVTMYIQEVKVFTPTAPDSVLTRIEKGFTRNLKEVASGAVDLFVWFIASLPILIVMAVVGTILFVVIRKFSKPGKPKIPRKKSAKEKPKESKENPEETKEDSNEMK